MILQNFASSLKFIFKKSKMESLERGADMFKRSDLVRLIIPLIIEQILAATIGVADTFMVSSVGEAAMSGVSLVDTINILLLQVFAALATGGAIVVSQYLGKEDGENANIAAKQLVIVVTLLSLVLMAAVWFGKSRSLMLCLVRPSRRLWKTLGHILQFRRFHIRSLRFITDAPHCFGRRAIQKYRWLPH